MKNEVKLNENRLAPLRVLIMAGILVVFFIAVFARLNYMINTKGETYEATASSKTTKTITLYGKRGTIYDTNMVPLAYDRVSYNVTFYRDPTKTTAEARAAYSAVLVETIQLIESNGKSTVNDFWMQKDPETGKWYFSSGSTSETVEATRKRQWSSNFTLSSVSEDLWFDTLCENYGLNDLGIDEDMKVKVLALWQESRMNAYNSTPCTIAYDVGFETVSEIEVRAMDLDGIDIEQSSTRVYPQGTTACHVIGYISKISTNKIASYREQGYPNDAVAGSDGIESYLESQLSPYVEYRQGKRVVEINTRGKVVRELSYTAPSNGNSVVLTIDTELQKVMADALAENIATIYALQEETIADPDWQEKKADVLAEYEEDGTEIQMATSGAIVAMDPNSGRVLGMVSYPDYDLSLFNGGSISNTDWEKVQEGDNPLYNRAISTRDSPGSIFKLCTSLAGLSEGVITLETTISDRGSFTMTDSSNPPSCWTSNISLHQNQTIVEAIKNSCNYFFYQVGYSLGSTNIYKWAASLGLTSKTNIELPGETTSFVGNQNMLYDKEQSISNQMTARPLLIANAVEERLREVCDDCGLTVKDETMENAVKAILDIAVSYDSKNEWNAPLREVMQYTLGIPSTYISGHYLVNAMVQLIQELYWTPNETVMLAIGQSITQVSPIAVARYVSAIVNNGTVYDAQIVDKIIADDGTVVLEKQPVVANKIDADPSYFEAIRKGMEEVTDAEDGGTAASYFKGIDYIAAKTGTSQRTNLDVENNSWLVCYAPLEDPVIVVVVYIQNGYAGAYSSTAAIETIQYYLESIGYTEDTSIGTEFSLAN